MRVIFNFELRRWEAYPEFGMVTRNGAIQPSFVSEDRAKVLEYVNKVEAMKNER